MKKRKDRLLILLILIVVAYSSEINFMPNYIDQPDKWHLLIPMLIFYSLIIIQLIWNIIVVQIRNKKVEWDYSVLTILSLYFFAHLNNPKGNWQEIGYLGMIFIIIILASINARSYMKKKKV